MARRKFKNCKSAQVLASKLIPTLCLSAVLISGCSSTQVNHSQRQLVEPTWITQPPATTHMVYGVGQADFNNNWTDTKLAAQEAARLALAKQLNVVLSGETIVNQSASDQASSFQVDEIIRSQVPNLKLQGVTIAEEYQKGQVAYALAQFNRTQTIMQTELDISGLDTDIMNVQLNASDTNARLKQAIKVRKLFAERQSKNALLGMLQSSKVATSDALRAHIALSEEIISSIRFKLVAATAQEANLIEQLATTLTKQGFSIANQQADFTLSVRIDWQHMNKSDTYYSVAQSYVTLKEGAEQKAQFNSKVKGASGFEQGAMNKAVDKLAKNLSSQLARYITQSAQ